MFEHIECEEDTHAHWKAAMRVRDPSEGRMFHRLLPVAVYHVTIVSEPR
jgi:hypothetical protein